MRRQPFSQTLKSHRVLGHRTIPLRFRQAVRRAGSTLVSVLLMAAVVAGCGDGGTAQTEPSTKAPASTVSAASSPSAPLAQKSLPEGFFMGWDDGSATWYQLTVWPGGQDVGFGRNRSAHDELLTSLTTKSLREFFKPVRGDHRMPYDRGSGSFTTVGKETYRLTAEAQDELRLSGLGVDIVLPRYEPPGTKLPRPTQAMIDNAVELQRKGPDGAKMKDIKPICVWWDAQAWWVGIEYAVTGSAESGIPAGSQSTIAQLTPQSVRGTKTPGGGDSYGVGLGANTDGTCYLTTVTPYLRWIQ